MSFGLFTCERTLNVVYCLDMNYTCHHCQLWGLFTAFSFLTSAVDLIKQVRPDFRPPLRERLLTLSFKFSELSFTHRRPSVVLCRRLYLAPDLDSTRTCVRKSGGKYALPYNSSRLIARDATESSPRRPPVVAKRRCVASARSENRVLLNPYAVHFYAANSDSAPGWLRVSGQSSTHPTPWRGGL